MGVEAAAPPIKVLGRYALHEQIAAGGMASVHFGRLVGAVGFARTVAIKRLHERLAQDPEFTAMFLDEARLAARIRHPNVVQTLDVVAQEGELFVVMEYVQGESLSRLLSTARQHGSRVPIPFLTTILAGALQGLHAAHEATDEQGMPLGLVHRDVSPQNVLVGVDGVPRVLDFGVAKAAGRAASTRDGQLKGKLSYMAPEQLRGKNVTRAADIFAAGVVLWEALAGRRLFKADTEAEIVMMVLNHEIEPPSRHNPDVPPELDAIVMRALEPAPEARFATAREMARALEKVAPLVPATDIGEWVDQLAQQALAERALRMSKIESGSWPSQGDMAAAPPSIAAGVSGVRDAGDDPTSGTLATISKLTIPTRSARLGLILGGIGAALLVAVVGVILMARVKAPPPAVAAPLAPPPVATAEPSRDAIPAPQPSAPVEEAPAPSAAVAGTASGHVKPAATAAGAARPAAPKAAAVNCDPPYVIDANGSRKYKRECLK